jgi:alpha,alpha-trehalase
LTLRDNQDEKPLARGARRRDAHHRRDALALIQIVALKSSRSSRYTAHQFPPRSRHNRLNLRRMEILDYAQELDLRQGVLSRRLRVRDGEGRETAVSSRRIVHMRHQNLAAIQMQLPAENWSGGLEIRSALDGRVINAGVERYRQLNSKHLAPLETREIGEDAVLLVCATNQSHIRIAEAARTRVHRDGEPVEVARETEHEEGCATQHLTCRIARGVTLTVEKTVALFTGRDRAISEPALAAAEAVSGAPPFANLLASHALAWRTLWDRGDIVVDEHPRRQMILRLHIFHLLQTVSPNTVGMDAGVPARGLHGEAYRGHIFWDELFILPYLNFHFPEISRELLLYRYRRLATARRLARAAGFRGAMYPWQSGSDGREESQVLHLNPRSGRWTPDNTHLQRHVGLAIAYNIWRYWQTTEDRGIMAAHCAEMLVEIARFWASIVSWDNAEGRCRILGVMGPDEFHDRYPWREGPGLDDNAYTNVMAAWVLGRAADALDILAPARREEVCLVLGLTDRELAEWKRIATRMRVPFLEDGIIAQFQDYDRLEELDWEAYRTRYGDIQRLDRILETEGDTINRYKASKQADVLMLFYLFSSGELRDLFASMGYEFDPDSIPRNIDYYMRRTSHGSTLSRVVHSWVLARSDRARSWKLLTEALESDLLDIQGGTTAEGIHLGAMAGSIDLIQRGQTALEFTDHTLSISPCLPEEMRGLHLKFLYRGYWLHLDVSCDEVTVSAPDGWAGPRQIEVRNQVHEFAPGERLTFTCHLEEGWRPRFEPPKRSKDDLVLAASGPQAAGGPK